jgi:hypothetical protein
MGNNSVIGSIMDGYYAEAVRVTTKSGGDDMSYNRAQHAQA